MNEINPTKDSTPQEVRDAWVAALRSGDYAQGKGRLHRKIDGVTEEFCCLGVLCDLAAKAGLGEWRTSEHDGDGQVQDFVWGEDTDDSVLPGHVVRWAGLRGGSPVVETEEGILLTLTVLNDNQEWDFNRIADAIERKDWERYSRTGVES